MKNQIGTIVYKDNHNKCISSQAIFVAAEQNDKTNNLVCNSLFLFVQDIVKNEIFKGEINNNVIERTIDKKQY